MENKVFIEHRKRILDQMENNSIFLIFSREKKESITNEKYNVNRNYYYASGVLEFGNIVVLSKINNKTSETIFINPYDEFKAKWVGAPLSKEKVIELSGLKDVRYLDSYESTLDRLLQNISNVYLDFENSSLKDVLTEEQVLANNITKHYPWVKVLNGRKLFQNARTTKLPEEIAEMKKAIEITNKGLQAILSNIGSMYEYQLESYFDQTIKFNGATGYAFPTIAASGINATCLHYGDNDSIAKDGDLILFDLGASVNMYCADISRTFPVNGKFSDRQKQIYNIVLGAQQYALEHTKPGITTKELNQKVIEYYAVELKKIGLINEDKEVMKYYYHGVSHHLGLDCHDLCEYTPLEAGAIITCEPGLYIAEENIGIRIEDDILITEDGYINLSSQIIKTVEDIESYLNK